MNIIDFHSINRKYENKIHSRDISPNSTERVSLLSHGPSAFLSHSFLKNSELGSLLAKTSIRFATHRSSYTLTRARQSSQRRTYAVGRTLAWHRHKFVRGRYTPCTILCVPLALPVSAASYGAWYAAKADA